jgi:hypothetical protein
MGGASGFFNIFCLSGSRRDRAYRAFIRPSSRETEMQQRGQNRAILGSIAAPTTAPQAEPNFLLRGHSDAAERGDSPNSSAAASTPLTNINAYSGNDHSNGTPGNPK